MICKSLLFVFSYRVKYHEILLHHIVFFTYDSYIVYTLFFIYTAFLMHYCTYQMYDTYIFNNNISHEFLSHTMYNCVSSTTSVMEQFTIICKHSLLLNVYM